MTKNDPIWLAYLWECWGPTPERQRELQELEDSIRAEGSSSAVDEFKAARARGRRAFEAIQELRQVYRMGGEKDAQNWLDNARTNWLRDRDIEKSITREIEQLIRWDHNLRNRHSQRSQKSQVKATLIDGRHSNCLRDQRSADCWTIYVDETGSNFDTTRDLNSSSRQLGRVVALAVPDGVELPQCNGFHAVDRTFDEVDAVLQRVLDAPIGVLGFSIRDETARNRYWIGHVLHLVRWTLLQLPVPTDGSRKRVHILIEQRDSYGPHTDLKALAQSLEGELAAIDPHRFQNLALEMGFMDKNHPMNGYVDVVAFTWGSTDSSNKDRLRKSKLNGHCFIDANERSLHHLFLALTQGGPLAPTDWYALCSEASIESAGGFLRRELDRLGTTISRFPKQWELYLAEVQMRLASKQYSLTELGGAIAWLQRYADQSQIIPGTLRLQLESSNLALSNHRGQIDDNSVFRCLELVQKLEDEAPQLVAETIVRMASTMTNNFQFNALHEVVDTWLAKPVAVAGLLNYGKLQSTRGQMQAFLGDPTSAIPRFDDALASFARLSDPRQVERETHQTASYKAIALMDAVPFGPEHDIPNTDVKAVTNALNQLFGNRKHDEISRSLASSDQSRRFEHHLWLRAINRFPKQFCEARTVYLNNREQWRTGSDHPWPLILAYRAWLLRDAGEKVEASSAMEEAITACLDADHGGTLSWMALVFDSLAHAINVPMAGFDEADRERLHKSLPHAPWQALTEFAAEATQDQMTSTQIWAHLAKCLPFNFH